MPLMSAALSGKLSHWWDMKTNDGGTLKGNNAIHDRIGVAHIHNGYTISALPAGWKQVSTIDGSGISPDTNASFANGDIPLAQMRIVGTTDLYTPNLWGPGSGSFTMTWWDYVEEDYGSQTVYGPSFGETSSFSDSGDRAIVTRYQSNNVYIQAYQTSASSTTATFPVTPESGRWNHWAVVVDKVAGDLDLYVNGSGISGGLTSNTNVQNLNHPDNISVLEGIGINFIDFDATRSNQALGTQGGLSGWKMDSFGVFNEALTSGNIQDLYNGGSGAFLGTYDDSISDAYTNCQHYYNFEDSSPISSGSTLSDHVNGADLTLEVIAGGSITDGSNEFYLSSGGISGTASSGSQDGDWCFRREVHTSGTGTDPSWKVMGSGESYSISFWKKGNATTTRNVYSVGNNTKSDGFTDGNAIQSYFTVSDQWYTQSQDLGGAIIVSQYANAETTNWVHYVQTFNRRTGQWVQYKDGVAGKLSNAQTNSPKMAWVGAEANDDYEFALFSTETWNGTTYNGVQDDSVQIDELCLFSEALDQRHIDIMYNAGSGTFYAEQVAVASGSASGSLGGYIEAEHVAYGSSTGTLGGYIVADPIVSSGSATGTIGGYLVAGSIVSSGSATGTIGGYIEAEHVAYGSAIGTLGGYILADPVVSSGSATGTLGGYVVAEAVGSSGSAAGTLGGYVVAIPLADPSGVITIPSPPVSVYSWDTTKNDPSGYRNIESGPYLPSAKSNLVGGFNKAAESGVALTMLDQLDLTPSATVVGGTKALTVSLGQPSGQNFNNASAGDILDGLRIYNVKMWMNDTADLTASGISPTTYYRKDTAWTKNIALTSASSGVAAFPTTLASGIDLGSIETTGEESSITEYLYLFVELPSGTYSAGSVGGLNGGYSIRVSYDYTGEGDLL